MALDLTALSPKEAITVLYVGYYDRAPDPAGLQYWIDRHEEFLDGAGDGDAGMSLAQIAESFSVQNETTTKYPFFLAPDVASAQAFITSVYLNLFNRAPDAAGLAHWTGEIIAAQADNSDDLTVGTIIVDIISGALDSADGNDLTTITNKIAAATNFVMDLTEAGIINSTADYQQEDPAAYQAAVDVLDGVTDDPATVTAAAAETDTFVSQATNTAPTAGDDTDSVAEDGVLNGSLTGGDSDPDGDSLSYSLNTGASNGSVTVNANGTYTYTPDADYTGTDSFTYTIDDGRGGTDTATATITVTPVNDAPTAVAGAAALNEDDVIVSSVTASDVEDATVDLVFSLNTGPSDGVVTVDPDGTYEYTPDADFNGTDSFTYTVTDTDGGTDTATVSLTISPVNDAPVAINGTLNAVEDTPAPGNVSVLADDIDGDLLGYAVSTQAANGTVVMTGSGAFTYTPNANFNGTDDFTFTVFDGSTTDTATVSISVAAVNDAPVSSGGAITVNEDTSGNGLVTASDVDGDPLTFALASYVGNGSVTVNPDGTFNYTPGLNENGTDSFTYTVSDGQGGSTTQTVNVTINPINDAPVAGNEVASGNEDTPIAGNVSDSTSDVDGDSLIHSVTVNPNNGTVAMTGGGAFTYTPNLNFNGTDAFQYTVSDGNGGTDTAVVSLTVNAVNDAPTTAGGAITVTEDTPGNGVVTGSDVDGDPLTFALVTNGSKGAATVNADGTFTYVPNADATGTDSFTYSVNDGSLTNSSTVNVTITPVNDAPVAGAENATTAEDTVLNDSLPAAADVDGGAQTFALLANASNGSVTVNGNGTYTYTPNANFHGTDSFTYTVNDGAGGSDTGTATITVTSVNDPVVPTTPIAVSTLEDIVLNSQVTASDADGDVLTYSLATNATNGDVAVNADGTFTYTPDPDYNGPDSFTWSVTDNNGSTQTGTVNITVDPVDDVLTTGIDNLNGGSNDDVYLGNENTLTAGDVVIGGGGTDKVIVNTTTFSVLPTLFNAFTLDVEELQVTADGILAGVTYDLSSSSITGNTLTNTNSTVDVRFLFTNMNPDGPDADGRGQIDLQLLNLTNNANTRLDVRNGDVGGGSDEANVKVTSSDDDLNNDTGIIMLDDGLEFLDLDTIGSAGNVAIDGIVTDPNVDVGSGVNTVNIQTAVTLQIGDTNNDSTAVSVGTFGGGSGSVTANAGADVTGFENPFGSATPNVFGIAEGVPTVGLIDASATNGFGTGGSTGNVRLSGFDNAFGFTIRGGSGNDLLTGSNNGGDAIFGNGGNDTIDGNGGNDTLRGGDGNDVLIGGAGNDVLFGDANNDALFLGEAGGAGQLQQAFGGSGDDFIDAAGTVDGALTIRGDTGNDVIVVQAANMDGRADGNNAPPVGFDQIDGNDGSNTNDGTDDTLFLLGGNGATWNDGSSANFGLNDTTRIEQYVAQDGGLGGTQVQNWNLGTGANPPTVLASNYNAGQGSTITFDGRDDNVSLNVDAQSLTRGVNFLGSDAANRFEGSSAADTITADSDFLGANPGDSFDGNGGNDLFLFGSEQLQTGGIIVNGGGGTDTIQIQEGFRTAASGIDGNFTNIQVIEYQDTNGNNSNQGDTNLSIDGTFTNGGAGTLTVTGSDLGLFEDMRIDARGAAAGQNFNFIGGNGDDQFRLGQNLDGNITIDGGADNLNRASAPSESGYGFGSSNILEVNLDGVTLGDGAFANVSNMPIIDLESDGTPVAGTINLGANAVNAGVLIVDASALDAAGHDGSTIDASGFTNDLTVIDGDADLIIITDAKDSVVLAGGTDNISTGQDEDKLFITGSDLDDSDTVDMGEAPGAGTDTDSIVLRNGLGGVDAGIDLDTQTNFEKIVMETGGRTNNDTFTLRFQDGGVGTYTSVTDVEIDFSGNNDAGDTTNVILEGANSNDGSPNQTGDGTVTSNLSLSITGQSGSDNLVKGNTGNNNKIVADLGAGNDSVRSAGTDMGDMTVDGGSDNGIGGFHSGVQGDFLDLIVNGPTVDDDAINFTNFETVTSTGAGGRVVGTFGREFDEAGILKVIGGLGDDNLTLNGDFNNALVVEIDAGGDDTIDASASTSVLTIHSENGGISGDTIKGGSTTGDLLSLDFDSTSTADLTNMSGVETIEISESGSGTFDILLGTGTTALTINVPVPGRSEFDGETLNIDGSTYGAAINYNGSTDNPELNITTGASGDTINAGSGNDTIKTQGGADTVNAGAGNDNVEGGAGIDTLNGEAGNDTIDGGADNDIIDGGADNDVIIGGANANPLGNVGDVMTGGTGDDIFCFVELTDSNGLNHDRITDFASGSDKIAIESIMLENAGSTGGLNFAGGSAINFAQASGAIALTAGDGLADWIFQQGNAVEKPTLWIDINDDGVLNGQDLQIEMDGVTSLAAGDVILVDTIGPAAPVISSITTDSAGVSPSDFITNDDGTDGTAPRIQIDLTTGTLDGTSAKAGDTLTITSTSALPALSTMGATADSVAGVAGGGYVYTLTAADIAAGFVNVFLGDGTAPTGDFDTTLTATVTDLTGTDKTGAATGAQVSATASQAIEIDVTATIAITSVGDDVDNTPISIVNSTEQTDVAVVGTIGDVEETKTITLTFSDGVNADVVVTGVAHTGGAFDTTGDGIDISLLNDGAVTVTATATDVAGNVATTNFAITKDTIAELDIQGPVTADNIINGAEEGAGGYTFGGTSNGIEVAQLVTMTFAANSGSFGVAPLPAIGGGGAWVTIPAAGGFHGIGGLGDGTYTVTATAEDLAGNTATDTLDYIVDTTGPTYTITKVTYDEGTGAGDGNITVDGTFPVADIGALGFDVTQAIWNNGAPAVSLGAQDIDFVETSGAPGPDAWAGSATQLVLNWDAGRQAVHEAGANVGGGVEDTLTFGAGILTDALGNGSVSSGPHEITLIISTSVQGVGGLVGFGGDDILTADAALTDNLTGGAGADTFIVDTIVGDQLGIGVQVGDINDFNGSTLPATEGDLIKFDASDLNLQGGGVLAGVFGTTDDGARVAFRTYEENGNGDNTDAVAATTLAGTFIYDDINKQLRFDVSGDTSFNGFVVQDASGDDLVVDVTGLTGLITAADIGFI